MVDACAHKYVSYITKYKKIYSYITIYVTNIKNNIGRKHIYYI